MQTVSCLRLTFDEVSGCIKPDSLQQSQYYENTMDSLYNRLKVELGRTN